MKKRMTAVLLSALMFTGCRAETTEVRERAYVQSAVFSGKDETSLTLYPFEDAGDILESKGANTAAAVEEASVKSGRDVFLGHTELLCFDEPAFTEELESCLMEYRLSPGCKMLFLHETELPEDCDTTQLTDSLKMEEEKGRIPETDLYHVLSEYSGSDGSALVPALTEKGFALCVIDGSELSGVLSDKAAAGLVWLRGDNYPERIAVAGENGTEDYEVYSADAKLSAEIVKGIPHVRAEVSIKGNGNGEAAASLIKVCCQAAIEETLKEMKADVIGLDACLAQDCPEYYAQQDFETAKWAAEFECVVEMK